MFSESELGRGPTTIWQLTWHFCLTLLGILLGVLLGYLLVRFLSP